jgi:hypothetical protein
LASMVPGQPCREINTGNLAEKINGILATVFDVGPMAPLARPNASLNVALERA